MRSYELVRRGVDAFFGRVEVTPENIGELRQRVAQWRENIPTQLVALCAARIIGRKAGEAGMYDHAVGLAWEEFLVGKHILGAGRDYERLPFATKARRLGLSLMRRGVAGAARIIEEHGEDPGVKVVARRQGRFAGDLLYAEGNYTEAAEMFGKTAELYAAENDPLERVNALEIRGMQAGALVMSGQVAEGARLADFTFGGYDGGDGSELKERGYYTWAVWKSGCAIKLWHAILESGGLKELDELQRQKVVGMLVNSYLILRVEDEKVWGEMVPEIRRREVGVIWERLRNEGVVSAGIEDYVGLVRAAS